MQGSFQEVLLATKIVVDGGYIHTRYLGNIADGQALDAVSLYALNGCQNNLLLYIMNASRLCSPPLPHYSSFFDTMKYFYQSRLLFLHITKTTQYLYLLR